MLLLQQHRLQQEQERRPFLLSLFVPQKTPPLAHSTKFNARSSSDTKDPSFLPFLGSSPPPPPPPNHSFVPLREGEEMGICLSKKKKKEQPPPPSAAAPPPPRCAHGEKILKEMKTKKKLVETSDRNTVAAELPTEKKLQVLVAAPTPKKSTAVASSIILDEAPAKLPGKENASGGNSGGAVAVVGFTAEDFKSAPVRTSNCTKEEVDAILIQCGRLSRSSSGKASGEAGAGHRRYSGSKRSYDFDSEKKAGGEEEEEGEEWGGRPVSRPSPRRRTPARDRSGSRERSGSGGAGGGRRVSRSPGRRSETPAASGTGSERSRQPAKMVSVPAREKAGRGASPAAAANRRGSEMGAARAASPRSRSPANPSRISNENALHHGAPPANQPQSLSRSSSRKAEQSPCKRNPMAEIHENAMREHQNVIHETKMQKTTTLQSQKSIEDPAAVRKSEQQTAGGGAAHASNAVKTTKQVVNKEKEMETETVEDAMEKGSRNGTAEIPRAISRTRSSSRRCSRDLDHALDSLNISDNLLIPNSYTSMLLEDIQNYHQQHQGTAFSLPACVSKACSILEAVADLNSTSSENKNSEGDKSANGNGLFSGIYGRRGLATKDPFMESEIVVKDDLMEPSLHKYVTVRDLGGYEMEPQESAGSNSFVGQPWASPWGPNSVDSTDPYWTSSSINGDEVEQEHHLEQPTQPDASHQFEARGRRSRGATGSNSFMAPTSNSKRRELHHHSQLQPAGSRNVTVASGRTGGSRAYLLPAAPSS